MIVCVFIVSNLEYQQKNNAFLALDPLVFAEMSVKLYIGLENFFVSVYLSVCVSFKSDRRNYDIFLKLSINVYALCEISCIVFGVQYLNSACTEIHKSFSMYYALWWEILKNQF